MRSENERRASSGAGWRCFSARMGVRQRDRYWNEQKFIWYLQGDRSISRSVFPHIKREGGLTMTRRTCFTTIVAAVATTSTLTGKENNAMRELLEASQSEKKGVMLYVKGQTIGGAVVKLGTDTVELRSREYSRIVVKIDAIDAVAMS